MGNSSDFITIGGGKLYIQKYDASGNLEPLRYFGLTSNISLKTDVEFLEHENTEGAIKTTDKKIVKKQSVAIDFSTDEISPDMLALAFLGEKHVNTAITSAEYSVDVAGAIIDTGAVLANLVLKSGSKTLEVGVDYTFSPRSGLLEILKLDNVTSNKVTATFTNAKTTTDIYALKGTTLEAKLIFIGDVASGKAYKYTFHKVSLAQSGEFSLKGDDWFNIAFSGEVLKDEKQKSGSQFFNIMEL